MITRAIGEAVLGDVIAACDPARRVAAALASPAIAARLAGRRRFAIAIGKAAVAMARGAGEIEAGLAVVPAGTPAALPARWRVMEGVHPVPDARSVAAGAALAAFMADRRADDVVLALISGGASALAEQPVVALDDFVAVVSAVMAAGASIHELNAVRGALSAIKAGQLALASPAPVVTLAVSDVIGDRLDVIGSGPTIGPWLTGGAAGGAGGAGDDGAAVRRRRARAVLGKLGLAVPAAIAGDVASRAVARPDFAQVIAPMMSAAHAAVAALAARGIRARLIEAPLAGDVADVVDPLASGDGPIVAWGEPTVRVPAAHGEGGRAQQLALALAGRLRGSDRGALVVGTDGIDGPPPRDRPAPAGAWVDGATWDAVADPAAALARCDAGGALAAVGALVVTGPSGINHADLVIVG